MPGKTTGSCDETEVVLAVDEKGLPRLPWQRVLFFAVLAVEGGSQGSELCFSLAVGEKQLNNYTGFPCDDVRGLFLSLLLPFPSFPASVSAGGRWGKLAI